MQYLALVDKPLVEYSEIFLTFLKVPGHRRDEDRLHVLVFVFVGVFWELSEFHMSLMFLPFSLCNFFKS